MKPTALIVAPTPHVQQQLASRLADNDLNVVLADSFASAKTHLTQQPDLLVSEVRLGAFNGLHLALRAQARGVPAIVIGSPDQVLEREAERLGAVYVDVADLNSVSGLADRLTMTARVSHAPVHYDVPALTFDNPALGDGAALAI